MQMMKASVSSLELNGRVLSVELVEKQEKTKRERDSMINSVRN